MARKKNVQNIKGRNLTNLQKTKSKTKKFKQNPFISRKQLKNPQKNDIYLKLIENLFFMKPPNPPLLCLPGPSWAHLNFVKPTNANSSKTLGSTKISSGRFIINSRPIFTCTDEEQNLSEEHHAVRTSATIWDSVRFKEPGKKKKKKKISFC